MLPEAGYGYLTLPFFSYEAWLLPTHEMDVTFIITWKIMSKPPSPFSAVNRIFAFDRLEIGGDT